MNQTSPQRSGTPRRQADSPATGAARADLLTGRLGLADGPLTDPERRAARLIAAGLGMTQAQAIGVVTMAEQGAQQG